MRPERMAYYPTTSGDESIRVVGPGLDACPVLLNDSQVERFFEATRAIPARPIRRPEPQREMKVAYAPYTIDEAHAALHVTDVTMLVKHDFEPDEAWQRTAVLFGHYRRSQRGVKIFNKYVVERDANEQIQRAYRMAQVIQYRVVEGRNIIDEPEIHLVDRRQSTFYEPLTEAHLQHVERRMDMVVGRAAIIALRNAA